MILTSSVKIIHSEHGLFNPLNLYFLSTIQSQRTVFKMNTHDIRSLLTTSVCLLKLSLFYGTKNLTVKSTMFPHRNIHKYTWTSTDLKTHNQIGHVLIYR
jgi:hypothetical protein